MAISLELLRNIIIDQREEQKFPATYMHRSAENQFAALEENREIIIITGLRRCGKSVLLQEIRSQLAEKDYYFNFEDERLVNFALEDFQQLLELFIILFGEQDHFYFDEIQNIPGWEMFVRRLYNFGKKIYITGSNANLFSEELGTRLTGRYIATTMYPISFIEYVQFKDSALLKIDTLTTTQIAYARRLFVEYMKDGGIPEYIKNHNIDYLQALYESILYKDIVARYKIPDVETIKKLLFFLASNCGKEITYRSLQRMIGNCSPSTISKYCSYIQNSFLCFFVDRYEDSIKLQQQAPKKVYFIDHAVAKTIGFRVSEDYGRILENIVFLELKRNKFNIFYHKNKKECDFVVRNNIETLQVIQVCKELSDPQTREREFLGLIEAMERFNLPSGLILTENENFDTNVEHLGKKYKIEVKPIWSWLIIG